MLACLDDLNLDIFNVIFWLHAYARLKKRLDFV